MRHFCSLIRPDERESVERSIWQQINLHSDGMNDYVRFHFAMKGGVCRDVFYVLMMESVFIKSHYGLSRVIHRFCVKFYT